MASVSRRQMHSLVQAVHQVNVRRRCRVDKLSVCLLELQRQGELGPFLRQRRRELLAILDAGYLAILSAGRK